MTLRILHISDTHFGAIYAGPEHERPPAPPVDGLERLLAKVTGPFDAVVHTGDITDAGGQEHTAAVLHRLRELGAPVLGVPGNHDLSAEVADVFGIAPLEVGGWRIIGVDTVIPGAVEGTAARIIETIDGYDARPTLLAVHHPIRSNSTHEWFVLRDADGLLPALEQRPHVRAVLSGHTHEQYQHTEPWGLRHLGGQSTYYGMRHSGTEFWHADHEVGAQLVELADDTVAAVTPL